MKKIVIVITAIIVFFCTCWCCTHYHKDAVVTSVIGNTITCEDVSGNNWKFFGEGYKVNDVITLTIYNHTTDTINDDEVVNAK